MSATIELISGGYILARPTPRLHWLPPELPSHVLSGSHCLTEYVLDSMLNGCYSEDEQEMVRLSDELGVGRAALLAIQDAFLNQTVRGDAAPPYYFASTTAARALVPLLGKWADGLTLFGMSTQPRDVDTILGGPWVQHTYEDVLRRRQPPEPGDVLGWDVLGADLGGFHSWFCNHINEVAELNARPNAHGFIDSLKVAQRVADYCNNPNNAEPGHWAPWQIRRYPL